MTDATQRILFLPLAVLAAAACALVSATPSARACSCLPDVRFLAPRFDATDVPTDARLWLKMRTGNGANLAAEIALEPNSANVTSCSEITLAGSLSLFSCAMSGLQPGTTYTATVTNEQFFDQPLSFTVADQATAAPDIPRVTSCVEDEVTDDPFGGTNSCGEWHKMDVVATQTGGSEILVAVRDGGAALDTAAISGAAALVSERGSDGFRFYFGNAPCGPTTWNVDEGSTKMQIGAFAINGEFSGWSGDHQVTVGCQGGDMGLPGAAPMLAALLWLMVIVRRRRAAA